MAYSMNLLATSPEDLKNQAEDLYKSGHRSGLLEVNLIIDDLQLLVCPFELQAPGWLRWIELKKRIQSDAAELLSLAPEEVVADFQIFERIKDQVHGIYVCFPKEILEEYMAVLDKWALLPIRITSPALINLDHFLNNFKDHEGRTVYLDFAGPKIHLSVFDGEKCEYLRVIPIDERDTTLEEINKSIKSACAKSGQKDCARLCCSGDFQKHQSLVGAVAHDFGMKIQSVEKFHLSENPFSPRQYCRLSLAKPYVFGQTTRRQILAVLNMTILALLVGSGFLAYKAYTYQKAAKSLQSSFKPADYQYALDLQKTVNGKK